ncbi:hypothetical protein ACWEQL_13345 [Kitasatospora sp. NPDC004240]
MNSAIPTDADLAKLVDVLLADEDEGRDRAGLEAFARERFAAEVPGELPDHWWIAVPGETYEAAFEVLGLHDRIPVTVRYGHDSQPNDDKFTPEPVYRVFITPEYAGWRLIYANSPLGQNQWWYFDVAERLSKACGRAQAYYQDPFADGMIWAAAEDGVLVRSYARSGEPEWTGEPLPWEEVLTVDDFDDQEHYEDHYLEPNQSECADVNTAAAHLSLDPSMITADTPVRGHAWLALTVAGAGFDGFDETPEL